jgi:L-ascorbate metabolism protein UlaG (beta-lactamase superfamily)
MEIQFYGANCLKVSTKKSNIVVDDILDQVGLKSVTKSGDTVLFTEYTSPKVKDVKLVINQPGEYEISDISVTGIGVRSHNEESKQFSSTIFKIEADDIKIAVFGHIFPELSNSQIEELGEVDVLFLPVGGNGYTLNGTEALALIRQIEPGIVVPTHYASGNINYPIAQLSLDEALKELGMEPQETVAKLKLKRNDFSDDESTKLIVLEQQ